MILQLNNLQSKLIHQNETEYTFITRILRDALSVFDEGAKFSNAYKKGQWDGVTHFISLSGVFHTGFLPKILDLAELHNIDFIVEDNRESLPLFQDDKTTEIGTFTLRSYQYDMVFSVNNYLTISGQEYYFPRGIIDGATNAGKNLVIAALYENLVKPKMLFLVHNSLIFKQAVEYFKQFFKVTKIDAKGVQLGNFTIAMMQSLHSKLSKDRDLLHTIKDYYNVVVVDEAHRAGGASYNQVLNTINAGMRIMISGTPLNNSKDGNNYKIISQSGNTLISISNQDLIDLKVSRKPTIKIHTHSEALSGGIKALSKTWSFTDEVTNLIEESESRLVLIGDIIAQNTDKYSLISFNHIKHGKKIYDYLTKRFGNSLGIEWIHGSSSNRDSAVERFAKGKIEVLIASMVLKEGVNIPIDVLIFAYVGKSVITVKQLIGRALRSKSDSKTVEIHDIRDSGKYLERHADERLQLYKKEGFDIIYI